MQLKVWLTIKLLKFSTSYIPCHKVKLNWIENVLVNKDNNFGLNCFNVVLFICFQQSISIHTLHLPTKTNSTYNKALKFNCNLKTINEDIWHLKETMHFKSQKKFVKFYRRSNNKTIGSKVQITSFYTIRLKKLLMQC